jgi:50S ribosomal subunit-associated GTPase HflX
MLSCNGLILVRRDTVERQANQSPNETKCMHEAIVVDVVSNRLQGQSKHHNNSQPKPGKVEEISQQNTGHRD